MVAWVAASVRTVPDVWAVAGASVALALMSAALAYVEQAPVVRSWRLIRRAVTVCLLAELFAFGIPAQFDSRVDPDAFRRVLAMGALASPIIAAVMGLSIHVIVLLVRGVRSRDRVGM